MSELTPAEREAMERAWEATEAENLSGVGIVVLTSRGIHERSFLAARNFYGPERVAEETQDWVCPHGRTFSGTSDFISGAKNAHGEHNLSLWSVNDQAQRILDLAPESCRGEVLELLERLFEHLVDRERNVRGESAERVAELERKHERVLLKKQSNLRTQIGLLREALEEIEEKAEHARVHGREQAMLITLRDHARAALAVSPEQPEGGGMDLVELPHDLAQVLKDPGIVVAQDAKVFELLGRWQNARAATEDGGSSDREHPNG